MKEIVIAVDLGGTNLRTAAIDRNGAILFRTQRRTPSGNGGAGEIVRAIAESAAECRGKCEDFQAKAISLAVPATVSVERGSILKAPNLPVLDGFYITGALESELGIESVLENDANVAAVGESWLGASKGFGDSITVTLGTGVGGWGREKYDFSHIVGNSSAMRRVYDQVTHVARSNATVLLRGESGTGKELIANAIHYNSLRAKKPFIKINCAALPETLIETELFGYKKGALELPLKITEELNSIGTSGS